MKPQTVADLLGMSAMTLRRWADSYRDFLTPQATPQKGEYRVFSDHDQKVFLFIQQQKQAGLQTEAIKERLIDIRDHAYKGLPDLPPEWSHSEGERIALPVAAARASELASLSALQVRLQTVSQQLLEATERADQITHELEALRASKEATEAQLQAAQLELAKAQGQVDTLTAKLQAYTFGGEKPVNLVLIILAALLVGAALVALTFILAALLG